MKQHGPALLTMLAARTSSSSYAHPCREQEGPVLTRRAPDRSVSDSDCAVRPSCASSRSRPDFF